MWIFYNLMGQIESQKEALENIGKDKITKEKRDFDGFQVEETTYDMGDKFDELMEKRRKQNAS